MDSKKLDDYQTRFELEADKLKQAFQDFWDDVVTNTEDIRLASMILENTLHNLNKDLRGGGNGNV